MVLMPIEIDETESNWLYDVYTRTPNNMTIHLFSFYSPSTCIPNVEATLDWIATYTPLFYELWKEHDTDCYL